MHDATVSYDEELAERVRALVSAEPGTTEQRMFGGLAFLIRGNLAVAASGQGGLLLRVDPERGDALLDEGAEAMVMRGRVLRGWVRVDSSVVAEDGALERWVSLGVEFARTLPAK